MHQYLNVVKHVLTNGSWKDNRTGVRTIWVPGVAMQFDVKKAGAHVVTTKRLAFKQVMGELCGFLRASRSAKAFRDLGCTVWDQNANENAEWLKNPYRMGDDDIGPVYGVQWRNWPAYKLIDAVNFEQIADAQKNGFSVVAPIHEDGVPKVLLYKAIDQLRECLDTIISNPNSRRILFHGWNCAVLDEVALPACHLLYQFLPDTTTKEISLCLYIRSNDLGLGAPFNMCEAAALLELVGRLTGYTPRWLSYFIGDAHIYENHIPMLTEQMEREPKTPPRIVISDRVPRYSDTGVYEPRWLEWVEPSDFSLEGYDPHPAIKAPMAV